MEDFYSELTAHRWFLMVTLLAFASTAFSLAVIGLYGVMAFTVSLRVAEMGIRIAFGAKRRDIIRLIMKHATGIILSGVLLGLLGVLALHKITANHVFGVSPLDPWTLAISTLLVILVSASACYIPARRAAKIDPMEALRYE